MRGLACGDSDRQRRCSCGLSASLAPACGSFRILVESKKLIGGGHLNLSFGNNIALVPWDKLAGAGTCLDQSHCVFVTSLDWLQS
jgi:hypothetical protein